jgi:hypothetical protein
VIFALQTYLENYFNRLGLSDTDEYAVSLAALYDRERHSETAAEFLSLMKRMRTVFYKRNSHSPRAQFEKKLLQMLDSKFKKKDYAPSPKKSSRELRLQVSV